MYDSICVEYPDGQDQLIVAEVRVDITSGAQVGKEEETCGESCCVGKVLFFSLDGVFMGVLTL